MGRGGHPWVPISARHGPVVEITAGNTVPPSSDPENCPRVRIMESIIPTTKHIQSYLRKTASRIAMTELRHSNLAKSVFGEVAD